MTTQKNTEKTVKKTSEKNTSILLGISPSLLKRLDHHVLSLKIQYGSNFTNRAEIIRIAIDKYLENKEQKTEARKFKR